MNPIILWNNNFKLGTITATDTAADYDPANLADERTYLLWMAASSGTKYLTVDCGSAVAADSLGIMYHNLATVGAAVSVESSANGTDWTERLAAFSPTTDRAIAKTFITATAQYWRIKLASTTAAAFIGYLCIGPKLTFPFPPDSPYIPYSETTMVRASVTDESAHPLETLIYHKRLSIVARFSVILRTFVFGDYQTFHDTHASDKRWFFYAWDLDTYPGMVFYCKMTDGSEFAPPLSVGTHADSLTLQMEAVKEW